MNHTLDIISLIIRNRSELAGFVPPDPSQIPHFTQTPESFSLQVFVAASSCANVLEHGVEVERWLFSLTDTIDSTIATVIPAFLQQAISSRLHFSTLNSWALSQAQNPGKWRCFFWLSAVLKECMPHNPQSHRLSLCKLNDNTFISATHLFCAKEVFPRQLECHCPATDDVKTLVVSPSSGQYVTPSRPLSRPTTLTLSRTRRHTTGDYHTIPTSPPFERQTPSASRSRRYSQSGLLGNFEECVLHGRIPPVASVDGFTLQILKKDMKSFVLPLKTHFFDVSADHSPSLYMSECDLSGLDQASLRIHKEDKLQAVIFNPHGRVVTMFRIDLDLKDMPPSSSTFVRQRVLMTPSTPNGIPSKPQLRNLIHIRLVTNHCRKISMHTDIRLLFSNKELDELDLNQRTKADVQTEMPENPRYSTVCKTR